MNVAFEDIHVKLGGRQILNGVGLQSREGQIVGLLGPNGCGKSTLIKTIFGLIPRQSGRVLLDGKPVDRFSARELASKIGYVGQDSACAFDFTVRDVVAMGTYARRDRANASRIIREAMEELDIAGYADRSIQRLSGGERKMVFIARAVAQGADIFVMDEPTNHLDIRHQLFVMDYLRRCGKTTLIVNHDLRLAAHYCDYLYMLADGIVCAEGIPCEVMTEANIRRVFGITGHAVRKEPAGVDFELF